MSIAQGPEALSDDAVEQVWAAVQRGDRATIVNSPPGAGKSTLVRRIALRYSETGNRAVVLAQTNAQVDDLVLGLAHEVTQRPERAQRIGRLLSSTHPAATDFVAYPNIIASNKLAALSQCRVLVTTVKKLASLRGGQHHWPMLIIDEAYQMRSDELLLLGYHTDRLLMVGDPGQLAPFTSAEEGLFRRGRLSPISDAATTIRTTNPNATLIDLPVSWRLDARAADVISDAFYAAPFEGAYGPGVRRLYAQELNLRQPERRAVHVAGQYGWAYIELPAALMPPVDDEVVASIAGVIRSLLTDTGALVDERGQRSMLDEGSIAVGVVHVAQKTAVEEAVAAVCTELGHSPDRVTVDTANRLQGREFDVTVVWHPLSGRRDASDFHLDAGRLCVLLSRHRHSCIVISRGGLREQIEGSPRTSDVWINDHHPRLDGTRAHLRILENLEGHRV